MIPQVFKFMRACLLAVLLAAGVSSNGLISAVQAQDAAAEIDNANQHTVQLLNKGQYKEALSHSGKTLQQALDALGIKHTLSLDALGNYASALNASGYAAKALPLLERVLNLRLEVNGARHPSSINALSNYAAVLLALGRAAEAAPFLETAVDLQTSVLGEKHPVTLTLLNNYAFALRDAGRPSDARSQYERALKLHVETLGDKHPNTLLTIHNYVIVLDSLGRATEALALAERNLKLRAEVLGEQHPNTVASLLLYAGMLRATGRGAQALPHFERAIELRTALLGARHPDTLGAINNYANALNALGRTAESLPHFERVIKLRTEVLGEKHPHTLAAINDYAGALTDVGRGAEAVAHYERSHALSAEVLGEKHPGTLTTLANLASTLHQSGRRAEAQPLLERALALRTAVLGETHPSTLSSLSGYALSLVSAGRAAEALPHFERAWRLSAKALGEQHPESLTLLYNHAGTMIGAGRPADALPHFERFIAGAEAQRAEAGRDSAETQRGVFAQFLRGYHGYLVALTRTQHTKEALAVLERTKARTLLEQMALRSAASGGGLPPAEAQQVLDYSNRIGALDTHIARAERESERATLRAERSAASRELAQLKQRLQAAHPRFRQITEVQLASADDARALLAEGTLFASYVAMDGDMIHALTVDHAGDVTAVDMGATPGLADTVEALRMWSANPGGGVMTDDTGRTIQILRWTDGKHTRWRVVAAGQACSAHEMRQDTQRRGASVAPLVPQARGLDAPAPAGGNAGANCIPPGAAFVSREAQYRELVDFLGKALIEPLRAQLAGKTRIIISPDGPLGLLPWDILPLAGKPLIAQFEVSQVQSLSVLKLLKERQADYGKATGREALLAMGNPEYGTAGAGASRGTTITRSPLRAGANAVDTLRNLKWAPLPGTQIEMDQAAKIFAGSSRVISGRAASETTLRNLSASGELANYRYLHFAAHGYFDPNLPAYSSLVLAPEGAEPERDGYVTLGEWVGLNLRSELTLLSACNTARGENVSGEGLMGLSYALYVAGNTNTVLTLWPVADDETAEFVASLLGKIKAGQTHAQALTATKREFMNHVNPGKRNPYFWAPFVLYGV